MSSRTSDRLSLLKRLGLLATLPLLAGCLSMDVPEPFLVIQKGSSSLKAVSPDEGMIWVKEFGDSHKGDLSFWSEVLKKDFVDNRGYTLLDEAPIQNGRNDDGLELRLEVTVGGTTQGYLVALFVAEGWRSNKICTVEYVARKEVFEKHLETVRKAIGTLDP